MREISLMDPSKETDKKLRWQAYEDGVLFKLYIPKRRVPKPWPTRLRVFLDEDLDRREDVGKSSSKSSPPQTRGQPIVAIIKKVREHTETVRYCPAGPPEDWEIGEPYIPYKVLPTPLPDRLRIEVHWDWSAGAWGDE